MAKVYLSFDQSHVEVYVDEDQFGVDWDEFDGDPVVADEVEEAMIEKAKTIAEKDGHDLTNLVEAVVGDF